MEAVELGRRYRTGDLSPVEVTRAVLDRIERVEPGLNSYIEVFADRALASARAAETQLRAGIDLGPLHGVPVSLKDLIRVKGFRTTAASRTLMEADADHDDAGVTERLNAGGAVILGHLELADHVHVSAASVVSHSLLKPGTYSGVFPIDENAAWQKNAASLRQLNALRERIRRLENNFNTSGS